MARLVSPTGVTVNVSDEKATVLRGLGYQVVGEKKAPARKPAAKPDADSKS